MYHAMTISGFTFDGLSHRPVVILKDADGNITVPLWISMMEAVSIAVELISRDITSQSGRSDLLSLLLDKLHYKVAGLTIDSLNDGVFSAMVRFVREGEEMSVDVRLCEALTLSLKYLLPVMVSDEVVSKASTVAMSDENLAREADARRFVDFLENLDPAALGKYPM
jgi:hypothetical protein